MSCFFLLSKGRYSLSVSLNLICIFLCSQVNTLEKLEILFLLPEGFILHDHY